MSTLAPALVIDPTDGSVRIDGCKAVIGAGLAKETAMAGLVQFYDSAMDMKTGYEWLKFRAVAFGRRPAGFGLCFYLGKLTEMRIGASLPNAKLEGGWPTGEALDEVVAFLRQELRRQLDRPFRSAEELFGWGVVWADVDKKGGFADAGLRYGTQVRIWRGLRVGAERD